MKDQLKRILNLVKKTGDTMIVTDSDGNNAYVVMDLDQYETLLDIHEENTFDIEEFIEPGSDSDDISWSNSGIQSVPVVPDAPDIWSAMKPAGETGETWDLSQMSDDEVVDLEKQYQKYAQEAVDAQKPAPDTEEGKTENSPKLAEKEEDFGEEQFYLEPIE